MADGAGKDCSLEFLSTAPKKMIVNPDGQRDKSVGWKVHHWTPVHP